MSEDQTITIQVNGQELQAKPGQMLIDVTDANGIEIPRFCYHKKLSVAANCRMCLVEVEKAPKPLPACATPVNDGMVVHTKSPIALAAQKGTMEFLLINHPLDCPVCDQGGECELQDVAVGYGSDISRYVENKRVVPARDIGPLITTCFTRCIHCTRCVRFGAEIAGVREMGATGRSEHMTIGTYVENSIDSELSGNIIDVCPVGALLSKPSQFKARAWEVLQRDSVAAHDSVGSNLHVHSRRNELIRVHPKDNEEINECWISDRDRFSYEGVNSDQRLTMPMIKRDGQWSECSWEQALESVAKGLKAAGSSLGALVSPSSTLEELQLVQKLVRGLGSDNIDFRLRQADFRAEPVAPWLGQQIADLEQLDAALLIGSNIRKDQPILGHRLRKAVMEGAKVSFVNPLQVDMNYKCQQLVSTPSGMIDNLAGIAKALGASGKLIDQASVSEAQQQAADRLKQADRATVLLGNIALAHPDYAVLSSLAASIAQASGATLGYIPEAANSVGARLVGAMPRQGLNAQAMLDDPCKAYLLHGIEPGFDLNNPRKAQAAFEQAEFVVALSPFRSDSLEQAADVILPISTAFESSGSFVNASGSLQSFAGAIAPRGQTRPAWKVFRVLGNLLDLDGFDQSSSEDVLAEVQAAVEQFKGDNGVNGGGVFDRQFNPAGLQRVGDVPLYAIDGVVRRAVSLQQTKDAIAPGIYLNPSEADKAGLTDGTTAIAVQDGNRVEFPVIIDPNVPDGCVRIPAALLGSENLTAQFGEVTLEKA